MAKELEEVLIRFWKTRTRKDGGLGKHLLEIPSDSKVMLA